ncbi:hypothetical protein HKX48_000115 [Thoreauomyces humboldtii]|nr:hypothetical protein HKX48_000115 [Thoreauomyces humboldtii]
MKYVLKDADPAPPPKGLTHFSVTVTTSPVIATKVQDGKIYALSTHPLTSRRVAGTIHLRCDRKLPIQRLSYTFTGTESALLRGTWNPHIVGTVDSIAQKTVRCAKVNVFSEPTVLPVGDHQFPFEFNVLPDYAPTWDAPDCGVRYVVHATLTRGDKPGIMGRALHDWTPQYSSPTSAPVSIQRVVVVPHQLERFLLGALPADDAADRREESASLGPAMMIVSSPKHLTGYLDGTVAPFDLRVGLREGDESWVRIKGMEWSVTQDVALLGNEERPSQPLSSTTLIPWTPVRAAHSSQITVPTFISGPLSSPWLESYAGSHLTVTHAVRVKVHGITGDGRWVSGGAALDLQVVGVGNGEDVQGHGQQLPGRASVKSASGSSRASVMMPSSWMEQGQQEIRGVR